MFPMSGPRARSGRRTPRACIRQLTLSWRPGRQAARHEVYLSTDEQAVINGTAPVVTVTEPSFEPGTLTLGQTYYWKVNEVNDAAAVKVWEGDVWSFSTQEYIVVDDFESYTDTRREPDLPDLDRRLGQLEGRGLPGWTWGNGTGCRLAIDAPFAEQTIVHGGRQSMPLTYSNAAPPFRSETERTFDEPQNWTLYGVGTLTVHFRGTLDNDGKLYVKINNTKVAYNGDAGGHRDDGLAAVEHRSVGGGRQPDERQETDDRHRGRRCEGRPVHR